MIKWKAIINPRLVIMNLIIPLIWVVFLDKLNLKGVTNQNLLVFNLSFVIIGLNYANLSARINSEKTYFNSYILISKKNMKIILIQEILYTIILNIVTIILFLTLANFIYKIPIDKMFYNYVIPSIIITIFYSSIGYIVGTILKEKSYLTFSFPIYGILIYFSSMLPQILPLKQPQVIEYIQHIFPIYNWVLWTNNNSINYIYLLIIQSVGILIITIIINILWIKRKKA